MYRLVIFLFFILTVLLHAGEKAWPGVDFTEVKAYHWPVKMNTESLIPESVRD